MKHYILYIEDGSDVPTWGDIAWDDDMMDSLTRDWEATVGDVIVSRIDPTWRLCFPVREVKP